MMNAIQYDRQIIDLLVDSFKNNRRILSMLRIQDRKNLRAFLSYCYHYTKEVGHIYYSAEGNTAILYIQNSRQKPMYYFTMWLMKLVIFSFNWSKLISTIKTNKAVKKIRAAAAEKFGDSDFLYVWFMAGKNPKGGMKGLLKVKDKILSESHKRKLPIYIETTVERLVPIYESAGFKFYHKHELGNINIHFAKYVGKSSELNKSTCENFDTCAKAKSGNCPITKVK